MPQLHNLFVFLVQSVGQLFPVHVASFQPFPHFFSLLSCQRVLPCVLGFCFFYGHHFDLRLDHADNLVDVVELVLEVHAAPEVEVTPPGVPEELIAHEVALYDEALPGVVFFGAVGRAEGFDLALELGAHSK